MINQDIYAEKNEILPGWFLNAREVSAGVYEVSITDKQNRSCTSKGTDPDKETNICLKWAFDLQKYISTLWPEYIFQCLLLRCKNTTIAEYSEAFGSWYVEAGDKRIVFEGRDGWYIVEEKQEDGWMYTHITKNRNLNFDEYKALEAALNG